jgi:hypothetical protein
MAVPDDRARAQNTYSDLTRTLSMNRTGAIGKKLAVDDFKTFLGTVKSMDATELVNTLRIAHQQRLNLIERGEGDPMFPWEAVITNPELTLKLTQRTKHLQDKGDMISLAVASGLMLWVHTLQTVAYPEARTDVRELWEEFKRAFPYMDSGIESKFPDGLTSRIH